MADHEPPGRPPKRRLPSRPEHSRRRHHASQGRLRIRGPESARTYGLSRSLAPPPPPAPPSGTPWQLRLTRYWLPGAIVFAGIVAMCFATPTSLIGGGSLLGAGIATAMVSWFYRIGIQSDAVREQEERARRYYKRYGRWPEGRV